ncbi:MAG: Coenzyme F420 hydrogenase/dehydrogenase, beta subunit C-terminal domain [Desulfomonile sp.]|nr:Coenzyme F420 hydrogenase/dehydrogenase, beta subunit C-terminal domain [Deltaproteobacteria bacterium]
MENVQGLNELNRRVLEKGLCAACGACVDICPYLTAFRGKTVLLDRCSVEHGRCYAYCPMTEFDSDRIGEFVFGIAQEIRNLGHVRSVMASQSRDSRITSVAQGGGTVSALLAGALEDQLIEAAVLTGVGPKDNYPCGKIAVTENDILSCTGSKYVGAHSLSALRQAIDIGYQKIAVVGLPCQVRSLRKMMMYDLKNENLKDRIRLVVGLFCNWAFDGRDFATFLAHRFNVQVIKKLHIPPPPANSLELETEDGLHVIPLDELRPLIQDACRTCPDMTSEFADISVGMYEGREGWNTLIVRTEIGQDLVRGAQERGALEIEAFPKTNLEHLQDASINKRKRASDKGS